MKQTIKGNCPSCGKQWSVEVEEKDYLDYTENGKLAQYAITGICNDCWAAVFGEEEDDNWDNFED